MSLRDTLSKTWNNIQYKLFPSLEKGLGSLSPQHKKLISVLELIRIEQHLPNTKFNMGRPPEYREAIARAFIAKMIFKFSYVSQLVDYLKNDEQLKVICGFNSISIPSKSTFSRAFNEFAKSALPERAHQAMIKDLYLDSVVIHVTKDSTPLEAREKHKKKVHTKDRKKLKYAKQKAKKAGIPNRRQMQLQETELDKMIQNLPNQCDKGMKKSAQGYTKIWKGYKLHAAVDDHCIPLAVIITSASLNDCEAAIPLALKSSKVADNFYDLMDAAYDHPEIKEHSRLLGHTPVIDKCPSSALQKEEKESEKKRKKHLNFKLAEDRRYGERFKSERFNALYKDYYGGRTIRYRGHSKVSCEAMFGVLTLACVLLLNLVQ